MKKILSVLLILCLMGSVLVQPALAAYGYENSEELKGECGITFDSNGGSGTMEPLWRNGSFVLPECEFTAPEGHRFKGWRWNGSLKQPGDPVYLGGVVEAVAIWEKLPEVTITFAPNGGSGTMDSVTVTEGEEYGLPQCTYTDPEGMAFDHWEVDGAIKYIGDTVIVSSDMTVTAVWVDLPTEHICQTEKVARVEPTQTEAGKEAYYYCEGCGNAYEDENASNPIEDLENWGVLAPVSIDEPEGMGMPWWILPLGVVFVVCLVALVVVLILKMKQGGKA